MNSSIFYSRTQSIVCPTQSNLKFLPPFIVTLSAIYRHHCVPFFSTPYMHSLPFVVVVCRRDLTRAYKKQNGSMNRSGSKKGKTQRLRPHVKKLMTDARHRIQKMVKLMMKQPPRERRWQRTV